MKLLHIDSSILGPNSASRQLSSDIVAGFKAKHSSISVVYRDLVADPLAHLTGEVLAAASGAPVEQDSSAQRDVAQGNDVLEKVLDADIVVIGAALYNFTIASQLKAWVDRIAIAGKTFRYTEAGPEGLLGSKKFVVAVTRGGQYAPNSPAASLEHAESYLRGLFGFLGVTDLHFVVAEGLAVGPEQRSEALASAAQHISQLTA